MPDLRKHFLTNIAQTSPEPLALEVESAKGSYIYTTDGEAYLDLISGICVSAMGHCHPFVIEAAKKQLDKYMHTMVYGEHIQSPQVMFAQALVGMLPPSLDSVYFVNSGAEAVEGAMKLCRKFTGRYEIIACRNAYHGSTHGAESLRSDVSYTRAFRPLVPGIRHINFNDREDLRFITRHTAGVVVEPVQGEAGVILPEDGYLQAMRERCNKTGSLLIFDEIQTGFGRSGSLYACLGFGVTPDILLSAKGLGGGLPLGAFLSRREIMRYLSTEPILGHITTFGGNPLSCTTGLATLNAMIDEGVMQSVDLKAGRFIQGLVGLSGVIQVRNKGLLLAVELPKAALVQKLIRCALEEGLLTDWFLFNERSFRIAPPLNISNDEIDLALDKIARCLVKLRI